MDRIINVRVNGHYLTKDGNKAGVKGEANATKLKVYFNKNDTDWGNCVKEVVFFNALGENPTKVLLTASNLGAMVGDEVYFVVPIPPEAMTEQGWMQFVVQGLDDGIVMKSLSDRLYVNDCPDTSKAGNTVPPTQTDLEQLRGSLEEILENIYNSQEAAKKAEEILEAVQNEDYWAMMSKSYAVGDTGRREGEDTDNSKYYYLLARIIATQPFMLEDDVTGDLYKIGVSDGLLYIEKIAGDDGAGGSDGEPPIEGGDSIVPGSGSISEYIESCDINEAGELLFYTNTGRVLNAGKLPVGELTEEHYKNVIEYINENVTEGDLFTDEFYTEIINKINEQAASGDVFTEEVYQEFVEYINNHITEGDVFTEEFYEEVINRINENAEEVDTAPDTMTVTKSDNTVTVVARYGFDEAGDYITKTSTIKLDDNGYPTEVTTVPGKFTGIVWEGFE